MKHPSMITLFLLPGMYLTACHSATKEKNSDSAIAIKAPFKTSHIAGDKYVVLTILAGSNWSAIGPEMVKTDAGFYCSNASDVQLHKIPAQYCSLLN